MIFKNLNRNTRGIIIAQAIGMLMGTSTHVIWAINNGFLSDEYNANLFSKLFWDSLTFLDPISVLLLIIRPKSGLYLTLVIIVVDVVHNNMFYREELYLNSIGLGEWIVKYWMILGQIIFGLFVILTFKSNVFEINAKQNK